MTLMHILEKVGREVIGWVVLSDVFDEVGIDYEIMILLPEPPKELKCLSDPTTLKPILDFF